MPSPFEAAWAARQGDIMDRFAEADGFLWMPQSSPEIAGASGALVPDENGRRTSDVTRAMLPLQGIFLAKGAELHAHRRSMADSTTRSVVADSPVLIVQLDTLGQPIQADDLILRQRTGERFRVAKVVPQQFGRGYVHLTGGR